MGYGIFEGILGGESGNEKTLSEQVRDFKESYNLSRDSVFLQEKDEEEGEKDNKSPRESIERLSEKADEMEEDIGELDNEELEDKLDELKSSVDDLEPPETGEEG
jgi:hypothetical protein